MTAYFLFKLRMRLRTVLHRLTKILHRLRMKVLHKLIKIAKGRARVRVS